METMLEYQCPCCGGRVEFSSASQRMKCPYCDTEFDIDALEEERTAEQAEQTPDELRWKAEQQPWTEADGAFGIYTCNSCGGEIVADETTAATHCPYCGNPVILTGRLSGGLRPDCVIPFQLDKKAAKDALRKHMSGKKLLPKNFREESHLEEIKGVYVPFWLFDAEASGDGRYTATRSRTWSDSNYIYTETSHYSAVRSGKMTFSAIPVDGAGKLPDDLMESLEPFDFSQAKPFDSAYLSGYLANRYDVDAEQSEQRANARIRESVETALQDTVRGYESVRTQSLNVRTENGEAKYALFPVWLMTTAYQGKNYLYAMNGQNGRIAGDMPIDPGAYRKWLAIYTAAIGGGLWALWMLLQLFF